MPDPALRLKPTQLSLLALLAIAMAIGAAALAVSVYISLERQVGRLTENWQRAIYQLQAEHLKLMNAVRAAEAGDEDYDRLEQRYEVFVSRITTLQQGDAYEGLRQSADLKELLPRLVSAVDTVDAWVGREARTAGAFADVIDREIVPFEGVLQSAALNVVSYTAGSRAAERDQIHDEMLYLVLCLAVMRVASVVLGGVTIKQIAALEGSRRQLSDALAAAERSNEAKSRFVASMSHEMRTPLNAVSGLLREIGYLTRNPEISNMVRSAQSSADMLCVLIDDVIDATRVEMGKFQLKRAPFRLRALLEETRDLLSDRAEDNGNTLTLDLTAIGDPVVETDRARMKQVLVNLIGNAVKFTRKGSVEVAARLAFVGQGKVRLRVSVSDTGIGIAPDQQERIFQRFYQTGSGENEGIGLGLSISRDIIERLGGQLGVTSTPGRGSRFWFDIPVAVGARADATLPPAVDSPGHPLAGLHILVAEDNGTNRQVVRRLLERLGATCVFAVDGVQAVRLAMAETYDLILLDINMPEMDGMTAFAEIRRLCGDAVAPVIALTASAMPEDVDGFVKAGMAGCVTKPIAEAELVQAVCRALGREDVESKEEPLAPQTRTPLTERQRTAVLGLIAALEDE